MPDEQVVRTILWRVARRLWVRRAVRRLLQATAMASAAAAGALLASGAGLGKDIRGMAILGVAALAAFIVVIPGLRRVTAAQAARALDATFGLGERFTTAVECLGQAGGMPRLVVQDAARWSHRLDLRRIQPAPVGREAGLALLGVAAASLVWLHLSGPGGLRPASSGQTDADAIPPIPAAAARQAAVGPPSADARPEARSGLRQALGLDSGEAATSAPQGAPEKAVPDMRRRGPTAPRAAGAGAGIGDGRATSSGHGDPAGQRGGAGADLASDSPTGRGSVGAQGAPPDGAVAPPAIHAATRTSGPAARQGLAAWPGSGVSGQAPGVPGREGPGVGVATNPGTQVAARGTGPTTPLEKSTNFAGARAPGLAGALRVDAVFTRMPVPPTLRQYILRYFDELGIPAKGEDPS